MPPTYTDEGLRAAQEIRVRHPHTAVLVLSQHLEFNYAQRLIQDNPTRVGYLLKERVGRVDQLLDALNRVTSGECVIDQTIVKELLDRSRTADPLRRADLTRARDPDTDRRRALQPGHLPNPVAQPENRRDPHPQCLQQTRHPHHQRRQPPRARGTHLPTPRKHPQVDQSTRADAAQARLPRNAGQDTSPPPARQRGRARRSIGLARPDMRVRRCGCAWVAASKPAPARASMIEWPPAKGPITPLGQAGRSRGMMGHDDVGKRLAEGRDDTVSQAGCRSNPEAEVWDRWPRGDIAEAC